jgi:hypothetical protein
MSLDAAGRDRLEEAGAGQVRIGQSEAEAQRVIENGPKSTVSAENYPESSRMA